MRAGNKVLFRRKVILLSYTVHEHHVALLIIMAIKLISKVVKIIAHRWIQNFIYLNFKISVGQLFVPGLGWTILWAMLDDLGSVDFATGHH